MQCNKTFDCRCATVNCRSVVNKTSDFKVDLIDHKLDICALTETWIREGDVTTAAQLCPEGYSAVSIPREGRSGGGIGVVYRSDITFKKQVSLQLPIHGVHRLSTVISEYVNQLVCYLQTPTY